MTAQQMLIQMLMGGNPQQALQNAIINNPQLKAMLNQQRQSGLTMEQFVRNYASQNNIDIEPMLNMIRQSGVKI